MTRRLYLRPWRVDVTVRPGVRRLVPDAVLGRAVAAALVAGAAPSPASIGLILTGDEELAALNARHMGQWGPTDVLSFPLVPPSSFRGGPRPGFALPPATRLHLGDVVVSVERAIEQAETGRGGQTGDVRWSPADEIRLLVDHVLRLEDGRIAFDGPAAGLLDRYALAAIDVWADGDPAAAWLLARGFRRTPAGVWHRTLAHAEKLKLLAEITRELGPALRNLSARDLEGIDLPGVGADPEGRSGG